MIPKFKIECKSFFELYDKIQEKISIDKSYIPINI